MWLHRFSSKEGALIVVLASCLIYTPSYGISDSALGGKAERSEKTREAPARERTKEAPAKERVRETPTRERAKEAPAREVTRPAREVTKAEPARERVREAPVKEKVRETPVRNKESQGSQDKAALRQFPEVNRAVKDVAPVVKQTNRDHIEKSAQKAANNKAKSTSADRSSTSPIASPAHDRGAKDFTTKNMKKDASKVSREAGPGITTIHEKPVRPTAGSKEKPHDVQTIYRGGKEVKTVKTAPRATGEHIHVQPDDNKRLHEAADLPRTGEKRDTSGSKGQTSARESNSKKK